MDIEIGPYILSRRTSYSMFKLFDMNTGVNITNCTKNLNKIIEDYERQTICPEKYFEISSDTLIEFKNVNDIKYLFIPDNIKIIGEYAFNKNKSIYIHFPNCLNTIEEFAFASCNSLQYLDIPEHISSINIGAFQNCFDLSFVNLPNSLKILPAQCFMNCSSLINIILPDSITEIKNNAFHSCENLENITFGKNVKKLGVGAFANCKKLSEIVLPSSIEMINDFCFERCLNLKQITLPDNITELYNEIFMSTENLDNINVPKKLNFYTNPFSNSSIKSLTINYDINEIESVFDDLVCDTNINKLIINSNVKTINPDAFYYSGEQITSINYLGTEEEFNKFKENNQELFVEYLKNLEEISFLKEPNLQNKNMCINELSK